MTHQPAYFHMTDELYGKAIQGGRYTIPPGWYYLIDDGPEGPYESKEEAEKAAKTIEQEED